MARRSNDANFLELIVKLGGLVILLSFINPQVRSFVATLGMLAVLVLAVVLVVGAAFLIFKMIQRKQTPAQSNEQNQTQAFDSPRPTSYGITSSHTTPLQSFTSATLIERLRKIDWFQFEKLVALIYENHGYRVTRRGGANPDGGVDLIIEKDGQKAAVQCKQWKTWNVGVKAVREFLGALTDSQIQHGIFITLNGYTGDARQLAEKHRIEIINENGLRVMIEGLNFQDRRILQILNDTTKYCPKCERLMVERVAEKGLNPGSRFWGCTGYPRCRFTMPIP